MDFDEGLEDVNGGEGIDSEKILTQFKERRLAWNQLLNELGPLKLKLIMLSLKRGSDNIVGSKISLAYLFSQQSNLGLVNFFSKNDLLNALNGMQEMPNGVYYNGELGRHIYNNDELLYNLAAIVSWIMFDKNSFLDSFNQLSVKQKVLFRKNINTAEATSRQEPFDLIANRITSNIIDFGEEALELANKIKIEHVVMGALARDLDAASDENSALNELKDFIVIRTEDVPQRNYIYCSHSKSFSDGSDVSSFENLFSGGGYVEKYEFSSEEFVGERIEFKCGQNQYEVVFENLSVKKLPLPKPLDYRNEVVGTRPLKALVTVALVDEFGGGSFFDILKLLRNYNLKVISGPEKVNTKEEFKKQFQDADMLLASSHAMDVNDFNIGSPTSNKFVLEKNNAGSQKNVQLVVLLPIKNKNELEGDAALKRHELVELLKSRRQTRDQSLFVLNTSCGAGDTVITWTSAYREMLDSNSDINYDSATDLPYVIASNAMFGTDSIKQISEHFYFPFLAVNMLTQNKSPQAIFEELQKPSPTNKKFQPVFNLTNEKLLSLGHVRLIVNKVGDDSFRREY